MVEKRIETQFVFYRHSSFMLRDSTRTWGTTSLLEILNLCQMLPRYSTQFLEFIAITIREKSLFVIYFQTFQTDVIL